MKVSDNILDSLGVTFVRESAGIAEYRLDSNGLKILLAQRSAKPVVTVMPVYRVGSRNEAVGYTGATHILEHMMFKGVRDGRTGEIYNFPDRFRRLGGVWNATTWFDRTNYFETVPARHLELCIATESDRMRNLLIKEEERAMEMTVVRNELERGENDPMQVLLQKLYAFAYREHPYHHPTIGWTSDVEAITVSRLKWFYDQFYWPDNTTLLVIGAFEPASALTWIAQYYSAHPASPKEIPLVHTVEPPQEGEIRFAIRRAGDSPRVLIGYHVPEATHKDNHAVAAVAAILGGGRKTSRLYKALVENGLASSAFTWHFEQRDPGMFMIGAHVNRGSSPEKVEEVIRAELKRLADHPFSVEELNLAKLSNRKQLAIRVADPMQLADMVGEAESVSDWTFFTGYSDALQSVTAEDVRRVAAAYFTDGNSTAGYFLPPNTRKAVSGDSVEQAGGENGVVGGGTAAVSAGTFASATVKRKLGNGMKVLILPEPGTGVVGIAGAVKAGAYYSPKHLSLLSAVAGTQLSSGTTRRSAVDISRAFEEMGSQLSFRPGNFEVTFNTQVAADDAKAMVELIADCLRHPVFPESELEIARRSWVSWLEESATSTESMANSTLMRSLYSRDSIFYDKTVEENLAEIGSVTASDLRDFHARTYVPGGAIIAIVGDVDVEQMLSVIDTQYGDWEGKEPEVVVMPEPALAMENKRIDVHIPDKRNATIVIGHQSSLARSADDFHAARIANAALGSGFTSRLVKVVRVQHGLTYGITSAFMNPDVPGGAFLIELSVNPANVERAIELVRGTVDNLIETGITEEELSNETGYAAGSFEVALRRADAIAGTMVQYELSGGGLEAMDAFAAKIGSLSVDSVNAALRKYIHPESFVTVVAGTLNDLQ